MTPGGSSYHTWAHIKSVLSEKKFNVQFTDVSEKVGVLSVQGPNRWVHLFAVTYMKKAVEELQSWFHTNSLMINKRK
jgi:glycine cleavage system aminomethyltransferase T